MRTLQIAVMAVLAAAAAIGGSPKPTEPKDSHESATTRLGPSERSLLRTSRQYGGLLMDAGCLDRTSYNLRLPSQPFSATMAQSNSPNAATGITVTPQTLATERADIMPHQVADMRTRQADPTCAVTGTTTAFALLLPSGRLLNLDSGGNTYAWQGVQSTQEGRAMLNGLGPGVKPYAKVKGYTEGSTLFVHSIESLQQGLPPASGGSATRMNPR